MSETKPSHVALIVVAIIGLIGTLGAAMIANWDKLFPRNANAETTNASSAVRSATPTRTTSSDSPSKSPAFVDSEESVGSHPSIDISGTWADSGAPQNRSEIKQVGNSFSFTRDVFCPTALDFIPREKARSTAEK